MEWEKISASHLFDKGLISKVYKELIQLIHYPKYISNSYNSVAKNSYNSVAKDLNSHFSKQNIQMDNRYMIRWSTSLIIREMKIKTKIRYHFIHVRMVIIKKQRIISIGEDVEELEPCTLLVGM